MDVIAVVVGKVFNMHAIFCAIHFTGSSVHAVLQAQLYMPFGDKSCINVAVRAVSQT